MPPVTKAGGDAFRKDVDFVAKDAAQQQATGIVMVPDKVDLQQDFAREGTIRAFADEFGALIESGSADGGIMHAAWPSEWMSLERNEVLDEAEEILRRIYPDDQVDDMMERAEQRRERREERDDPSSVGDGDQEASDDQDDARDGDRGRNSEWEYFENLRLEAHQLATALEKEHLEGDEVRVRTDRRDCVE